MERRSGCCGARRGTTMILSFCAPRVATAIVPWFVLTSSASVVCWWFLVAKVFPPFYHFRLVGLVTRRAVGSAAGGENFLRMKMLYRNDEFGSHESRKDWMLRFPILASWLPNSRHDWFVFAEHMKNKILLRAGSLVPPVEQEWFDGRKSPAFRVLRGASCMI